MDTLLSGGSVVTMDAERRVIEDGAVGIKGAVIQVVGPRQEIEASFKAARVVDTRGRVIIPGLVNTHTHQFQGLLKGLACDRVLVDWFRDVVGPCATALEADHCYAASLLGSLEALKSGATTLVDFMYAHPRPGLSEAVIRGFRETGVRGILARGFMDIGAEDGVPDALIEPVDTVLQDVQDLHGRFHGSEDGRIWVWLAACMIWSQSERALKLCRELADGAGIRITMHVAETPFEIENARRRFGGTDLQALERMGFLGPDVLAVHCVYLGPRDLRILKHYDVKVSHNPHSNMYLASGVAPVPDMLMYGITVGLATDGPASNNNQNMIQVLKQAALLHKVATKDPTAITAEQVLEMATIGGARAVGLDSMIGSLERGKRADVVVLRMDNPFIAPVHDVVGGLVYSALGNEVERVFVDGKEVVSDGRLTTLDEREVVERAEAAARDLVCRAGVRSAGRKWRSLGF
ncbi:MAG TPA: amidohydrolase [Firmicutes bacterium]|nr:amidohydrolase [Bacillota bacterium]